MFDIGPSELLIIFVVALLVIGPERLPSTVKTASLWIGRFRRSFHKIKAEVERELNADEIRRQLHNESILAEVEDARKQATDIAKDIEDTVTATKEQVEEESDLQLEQSSTDNSSAATDQDRQQAEPDTAVESSESSIAKDIKQTVSYVNDISKEVKASKEEIEQEFSDKPSGSKSKPSEKS